MQKPLRNSLLAFVLLVILLRCATTSLPKLSFPNVPELFAPATPREAYEKELRKTKLDQTEIGQAWREAGERALSDSLTVGLPFRETGVFPAEAPLAHSYRVRVPAGRRLVVRVSTPPADSAGRLFVDLFQIRENGKPKHLGFAQKGAALSCEVAEETTLLLRLQPELSTPAKARAFTILLESQPLLSFPVAGRGYSSLISFWGAPRDGGRRLHEGVDIAAPRGTPVLAAADGIVTQVTTNRLGGLVVYQQDTEHAMTLYYAHLHKQLARPGQRVKRGDTLGLVGNTGNAITTGPHLHFGVYPNYQGAADPLPFVDPRGSQPAPVTANTRRLGGYMRTAPSWMALRKSPKTTGSAALNLPKNTVLRPLAATQGWYRVALPDGTLGYVQAAQLQALGRLRKQTLNVAQALLAAPEIPTDTLRSLTARQAVHVLGQFGGYEFVETLDKQNGWVKAGR